DRLWQKCDLTGAAISPDSRLVVTAGADGRVGVWEIGTGKLVVAYPIGRGAGFGATPFSPDGRLIVTTRGDGRARVLWTTTGELLGELRHDGPVTSTAFRGDGRLVTGAYP